MKRESDVAEFVLSKSKVRAQSVDADEALVDRHKNGRVKVANLSE